MRLQLIDGGCTRRLTAAASIAITPPGAWEAGTSWPDVGVEGAGQHACVKVFTGRARRSGLQTGPGLDMGPVSLIAFRGVRWLGPDVLSFRLLLRGGRRAGSFERILIVDLAHDPARYLVRDLASGQGADVCAIPSVDRTRVWVQASRLDDEGRLASLSVYLLPEGGLEQGEGFPILVEACGQLVGRFSLPELTLGDYERSDLSMDVHIDWLVADVDGVVRMSVVVERRPDGEPSYWEAMYELTVFPDGRYEVERLSELLDPALWTIL